jgi:hypothetical protein
MLVISIRFHTNWLYKTETFELMGGVDKRYQHYVEDHANDLLVTEF